jgi:Fe-S cluster biogenesis protein NfuA
MAGVIGEKDLRARLQRLEALLQEAERFEGPTGRGHTREIVQALLDLHGAGLEKILDRIAATGGAGLALIDELASDGLVEGLLLLHGLHPLGVEERVQQALEGVRPYLRSHGGNVELLGVSDGVVRLRLEGSCHSCPSSAVTMKQTVEEAILGKAPEVTAVEVEEALGGAAPAADGTARVALPLL